MAGCVEMVVLSVVLMVKELLCVVSSRYASISRLARSLNSRPLARRTQTSP